ncbi:MAG: B12-binding domain-containing radical SAM protein [Candidatus Aenigmatarchaeota archaeon]
MRVLLVQPNYRRTRETGAWLVNPPIGLGYIASVLEKNNISVEIIDANALNLIPEDVALYAKNFDIIGVSMLTPAHRFGVALANHELLKNKLKVVGGPHASGYPEELLESGFDIVVRGEGEYSFLEIVQGKNLKDILGISFKDNGKIIHNKNRPELDVDKLPFPARHLMIKNGVDLPYLSAGTQYRPWSPIFTSRGCPYDCNFCNKKVFGYKFRPRSPENVVKEIDFLVKNYGVKEIDIYDDTFNLDIERAEKILDLIIERNYKIYIRTTNGLRADKVTRRFLEKMKKAGCIYIAYGIESGDQSVLDKIPKAETLEDIRRAVKLTKEVGIPVCGFIMFGLFGDTKETMQKTIDFTKELDLDFVAVNLTTPYPGTKLFDRIKKEGKFLFDFNKWEDFHHTSGRMCFTHPDVASPKEVEEAYQRAYREFYFRPRYLIRQLLKVRTWEQFKGMIRGGIAIWKGAFKKQKVDL